MKAKQSKRKNTKYNKSFILSETSPFLMQEDYKALRTNLTFAFPDMQNVCLAVTSPNRSDGKSTTSINLAISWAQMGKKVLLVECDLRLPSIADKLGLEWGEEGLSNLLIGECKVKDVIKKMEDHSDLYVLQSGSISADPTRLLGSDRMKKLIDSVRNVFDYIILDCPPVNMVVDACLLAPVVDGYLVVVRHNTTEFRDVDQTVNQLQKANANIVGWAYVNEDVENKKYYRKGGYYK